MYYSRNTRTGSGFHHPNVFSNTFDTNVVCYLGKLNKSLRSEDIGHVNVSNLGIKEEGYTNMTMKEFTNWLGDLS